MSLYLGEHSYEKPTNLAHVRVSVSEDTVEQVLADGAVLGDGGGEGANCAALLESVPSSGSERLVKSLVSAAFRGS